MEKNKNCNGDCPCGSSVDSVSGSSGRPVPITSVRNPGVGPTTAAARPAAASSGITVVVAPTTGGQFELPVDCRDSIENLKKTISKRFKVAKERICLLHRDKDLREGSLLENNIQDGSKITLLPMVETGLLAQRPEQTVLQALENLSDSQVHDFLSGRAPLNLTMRLGDHMMFIQLQLSTVGGQTLSSTTSSSGHQSHHRRSTTSHRHHHHHHSSRSSTSGTSSTPAPSSTSSSSSTRTQPPSSSSSVPRESRSSRPPALLVASPAAPASTCSACTASETRRSSCRPTMPAAPPVAPATTPSTPVVASPAAALLPAARGSTEQGAAAGQPITDVTSLLDTSTLAAAGRNLSKTLRDLSSKTLNVRGTEVKDCPHNGSSVRRQGAIIESMHHHGRGVYSGTFSGTLNPALQDRHGHPKRDISTIVHILNDLLGATPQYRRHGQRHSLEIMGGSGSSSGSQTASSSRTVSTCESASKSTEEFNQENKATRDKIEQLKIKMEERRVRRRTRLEAHAPYPPTGTPTTTASSTSAVTVCSVSGDLSLRTDSSTTDHLPAATTVCALASSLTNASTETTSNTESVSAIAVTPTEAKNDAVVSGDGSSTEGTAEAMDCTESADSLDTSGATNEYLKLNPETVVA